MQDINKQIEIVAYTSTLMIFIFILIIFLILILYKKKQLKLKKNLELMALNHEKAILATQLEIQEETMRNIGQEIHDNISLTLTLAKLYMNTHAMNLGDNCPEQVETSIDLIGKSLIDLNDLSKSLDSQTIEKYGILHALEQEMELLRKSGSIDAKLIVEGTPVDMEASRELLVFRIIQESFNNIIKHAAAKTIRLELEYGTEALSIRIRDNGKGFDMEEVQQRKQKKVSSGLRNMKNRAALIKAELWIDSNPGNGTVINLLIPYNNNHGNEHANQSGTRG
jgi:signal transduction histidine kinase